MLARMRERASSWMVKFILGIIVVVFVFLGVESYRTGKQSRVAVVNGETIGVEAYRSEYQALVEQIRRQFGGAVSPEVLELFQVQDQALQRLIDRQLLMQEADRQKLAVSDKEVAAAIATIPVFQSEGHFDAALYRRLLEANGMNAVMFEERQRQDLLLGKLQDMIFGGVQVSKAEAMDFYNARHQKVFLEAFLFRPSDFHPEAVTEEAILSRYESHKDSYRTEPMVRAVYLRFDPEDFKADLVIPEEELRHAYEARVEDFREPERVAARHILLKLEENAPEDLEEAKKKELLDLREKIVQGADFSEIAKAHSQCPSASDGGNLGIFPREAMVPTFSEAAFSLKEGEMSPPVRTRFGWHLIRVDKRHPEGVQTFESVREGLMAELVEEKAKNRAYEAADAAYEATLAGADLKEVATTSKRELRETDFFDRKGPDAGIVDGKRFAETAFSLVADETSELVEMGDALFLLAVSGRKESQIPDLAVLRERIRTELTEETAENMAEAKAKEVLAAMQKGEDPGVALVQTGFFGREEAIPGMGSLPMLSRAVFAMEKDKNLPEEPVRLGEGFAVFRIKDRSFPDENSFEAERTSLEKELKSRKQNRMYTQWMASLREKAEIQIEPAFRQDG